MKIARLMQQAAAGAPKGWDLSNAAYNGSPVNWFGVREQEITIRGIFLKPDGTKMYVVGADGDDVNEYSLSSAWDVSSASYLQAFSVASQDTAPTGVFFKPDGTKMYVIGNSSDAVNEYSLSTAWDISTSSYVQNFSVAAQEATPQDIFFKPDGAKMYVLGSGGDSVYEYDLSSAWDVSTSSYLQAFSVAGQETLPTGLFFKDDGTKMYVVGPIGDDVNEYSLSSAWDVSTASYSSAYVFSTQSKSPQAVFFKSDGTKMYIADDDTETVSQFDLSSAWDVTTASFTYPSTNYVNIYTASANVHGIFFKPDGTKMYTTSDVGDDVDEYSLSSAWDISTASYTQRFVVSGQDSQPKDLFFKPDGTKMYVLGDTGNDVNEYDLSSAWDISTASYLQNFSVGTQETTPQGIFFKPDGTKMYVTGDIGADVNEYSLSSAWDISTASYVQAFSVSAQETNPQAVSFKSDGTKMYILGSDSSAVNEYDLSTVWDISSASHVQSFNVSNLQPVPSGLFFRPDGKKMYVASRQGANNGNIPNAVLSYDL